MSEFFKCKPAWLLSGIHMLMVLSGLLYVSLIDDTNIVVVGILMILTGPWGFFLMALGARIGFGPGDNIGPQAQNAAFAVEFALGGLINAIILYMIVYLVTKAIRYLMK